MCNRASMAPATTALQPLLWWRPTCCDAVVDDTEPMHPNLLSSSLDVLQLVLSLHSNILNLADRLIYVWDLSFLRCLHTLCCHLQCQREQLIKYFRVTTQLPPGSNLNPKWTLVYSCFTSSFALMLSACRCKLAASSNLSLGVCPKTLCVAALKSAILGLIQTHLVDISKMIVAMRNRNAKTSAAKIFVALHCCSWTVTETSAGMTNSPQRRLTLQASHTPPCGRL